MKFLNKKILLLLLFPFLANANENFRYLGFEFNKVPEKTIIKDYTCRKVNNIFKECYLSSDGRKYTVMLDENDLVRKVSQSISTSSYKQKFSCLEHLKSYVDVLNNNYSANIRIPSYGLFSEFESTINVMSNNYSVSGNCQNNPEDVLFNANIEDINLKNDLEKASMVKEDDNGISNIKRDFE